MSVEANNFGFILNFDESYDIFPRYINEYNDYVSKVFPNGYPVIPCSFKEDSSMEDIIKHFQHRIYQKPLITSETDIADWRKSVLFSHGLNVTAFNFPVTNQDEYVRSKGENFHVYMMQTLVPDQYTITNYLHSLGVSSELLSFEVKLRESVLRCPCRLCNDEFEWYGQFFSFQPMLRYLITVGVDRSCPSEMIDEFQRVRSTRLLYGLSAKLRNIVEREVNHHCHVLDVVYQVCDRLQQLHDGCNGRFFNLIDLCRPPSETDKYYNQNVRNHQAAMWDLEGSIIKCHRFERIRNAYTFKHCLYLTDITPEKFLFKRYCIISGTVPDEIRTYWLIGSDNYLEDNFNNTNLILPHDDNKFLNKWYHWEVCMMWTDVHKRYIELYKNHKNNIRLDNVGDWIEWYDPSELADAINNKQSDVADDCMSFIDESEGLTTIVSTNAVQGEDEFLNKLDVLLS